LLIVAWAVLWSYVFKKALHKTSFFLVLFILLLSGWGILHITPVQNWLVKKAVSILSDNLKTEVSVKHVDIGFFNKLLIEGVLVKDLKKDTLVYAGAVKLNITDWFFLTKKPVIKYIGLSDAIINMKRSDSVWNYQFLLDYFATPKSTTKSGNNIQIDLKTVDLKNISFNKVDGWIGQDLKGFVGKMYLKADAFDFTKKQIKINEINLDNPRFGIYDYTGNRPINTTKPTITNNIDEPALQWNAGNWTISVGKITLQNGTFINERETSRSPYSDRFDGLHIIFSAITGQLNNVLFNKDTISTHLKLSTIEKSGFKVNEIVADMKLTPTIMEFNNLDIITDKSRVGNYYAMRYKDFNADMSDFLHKVKLEGKFSNSNIHSDDIAFFAPELKDWNRNIKFDGQAKGSIDNLAARSFTLKSDNTVINGDISLKGLPDINNTFIDFKSNNLTTNYYDLVKLIPSLKRVAQQQFQSLGTIRFKGNFTGFIKDFVAYGNINTSIGNLNADVNMKLPDGKLATYSGKISSQGLNIGKLFNNPKLGLVALDGKVKGTGLTLKSLNANFDGKVYSLEFSGYAYKNITLNGNFVKNLFTGKLDINDPNLKINNLNGSISLLGDTTKFNFDADLQYANLQELNLTKDNFILSGLLNFDFVGNNIDNFLGKAKMYNASLLHDSSKLSFDFFSLNSYKDSAGNKVLQVETNEMEGNIAGKFKILELPDAFSIFLNRYYPSYFNKPNYDMGDQDFSFNIKTKLVDEYVRLFDSRLKGFDNSTFSGNLRLAQNIFNVSASVPILNYDGKVFENILLNATGNLDSLNTDISVSEIRISDSLHLPNAKLKFSSKNDVSTISLTTSASKTISNAQLNARVQTYPDGVSIDFSPSSFILNDKKWDLAKDGHITLRKSYIEANNVKFLQGNQEIVISTELDELTDHTNLVANLKKVNINDFTQLILKQPRLEGILTGTLRLRDPFGKQILEFDAAAEEFRLDDSEIGTVKIKGDVNITTGEITAKGNADGKNYKFDIDGKYNYKDTSANQSNFSFKAERFDISILNNYLKGIFSNMTGNVNSELKIYGGPNHRYVTGPINITEGSLKIDYTQCTYKFSNETINFYPDEIDFGMLQLKDSLNNTGTASGKLHHNFFSDFGFDNIRFETAKMLLLNTSSRDNSQFYGNVTGKALMTLNGPMNDMRMNITGTPSPVDSSHIYIPTSNSQEYGKIDYIDFIQYGSRMEDEFKGKQESNFFVNMNLTANPACKIDVILDEATGDVIKGRGNGLLNITVGTKEPLTIRGKYDITDGEYKFNFQTFLQKYFSIDNGSITWNGDPYEAQIDIDAEYLAHNVDLSSLATSRGKFQQKSDLNIVAHLTNTLKAPKIAFEFVIPENKQSESSKDPVLLENLKKFSKDENEQNRQVASLLLFNTFINDNNGGFGASTANFLSGTAGQVISGFLNNQLTKVFQRLFKDPTITPYISFNSNYNLTSTELINALEASGNFGFKKAYINGRLIISLGGNIDYNNPYILQARQTNVLLTPDITVEYLLSADGKLRIVGFNRTVVDATLGQRNRTGVRLSYSRDFDKYTKAERIQHREERKKRKQKK